MHYMTKQEIKLLLAVAYQSNRTHHLVLLLGYATGARISQVLELTGTDVYAAEMRIKIHGKKRGKSRFHKLHEDSEPMFDLSPLVDLAALRGPGKLFGGLTRQYMDLMLKKYGRLVGIHKDLCHFHVMRHSIAMVIWDATQRPGAITTFLGHKDPSSAYQYLAENDGILAEQAVAEFAF
jgi:integrase